MSPVINPSGGGGSGGGALALIADSTLGGSAATIDFSGIPATAHHLLLVYSARSDTAAANTNLLMRLNNDSGGNYGGERVRGNAAAATAAESVSATSAPLGIIPAASATAGHVGLGSALIPAYAETTLFKGIACPAGWSEGITTGLLNVHSVAAVWASTAAVNRITLLATAGNLVAGSHASLYGLT